MRRLKALLYCHLLRLHGTVSAKPLENRREYLWTCDLCGKDIWLG